VHRTPKRFFAALGAAGCLAAAVTVPAGPALAGLGYTPGAKGVGDPYFPLEGNGGYDAQDYQLDLSYNPDTDRLDGRVVIAAKATQNLSRFNLDLQGMEVAGVEVNGRPATFVRDSQELMITPPVGLPQGRSFTVAVRYGGVPQPLGGPIVFGQPYGFLPTDDGAFVATVPNAASTWFPSNDHPSDKARYRITVTVPEGLFAASNGKLVGRTTAGGRSTFVWSETSPMAPSSVTATIGRFNVQQGVTASGIPSLVAIDPQFPIEPGAPDLFTKTSEVVEYFSQVFGPYPFQTTGGILDNLPDAGYSLETQTRPLYTVLVESTIAHELAHMWYAASVGPRWWSDVWLNEGFATYAQWMWFEHTGVRSLHDSLLRFYDRFPAEDPFWQITVGDPGRDTMFHPAVYLRGAMTLQVLRERIGDTAFLNLLRTWYATYRDANATTAQFLTMANSVAGQDVSGLLNTWLFTTGKPALG
jgi:aminopeptidase N